jgi:uncharacterized protein (TIGR03435 family)
MSEKIYTRLLRLYPSSFRKKYEGEALQLIRDRLRDETGFFKRARLWWDLVADVLAGLPCAYRNSYAVTEAASLSLNPAGIPSFKMLDEQPLGLGSILVGSTLSLIALAAFGWLLSQSIAYHPLSGSSGRRSPIESVMRRLNSGPAPDSTASSLQDAAAPASAQLSGPQAQPSTPGAPIPNASASSSETKIPPTAANASPKFEVVTIKPGNPDTSGKMSFDVASIRQSKPGIFAPMPNFALDNGDSYTPFADPGGRFTADFPLPVYIQFAYKLSLTPEQTDSMLAHLPKWVATDYFEIHAKVEGNPTKDQMRLMMQSLLADRFKLAVHFETQQVPVFALVLQKPGRTGPKLRPHSDGPPCDVHMPTPAPGSAANSDGVFPRICDAFIKIPAPNHEILLGSRNTTMKLIADSLPSLGGLGRPVVDQTGLNGRFDFTLRWAPESSGPAQSGADAPPDSPGTTFLEALKDQLGIKLKPAKAPLDVLVVDHVERPLGN